MVQQSLALTMWYGSLSAIAVSLGKGLQKYGVEVIFNPREMFRKGNLFKLLVWCLGTGGIVASPFLVFAACAYGPVTIVAAFSGTGLIALALFSAYVLKERIGKNEVTGITAIILGTALAGYFEKWDRITNYSLKNSLGEQIHIDNMVIISLAILSLSVAAAIYSIRKNYKFFGIIFGSISGFCGGISVFYQKAAMIVCQCENIFSDIHAVLRNPFFYLFAITGIGDFLVTQYALRRSKAVTVVPCYQSFYMAIPIAGGIVAYYESINVLQLAGVSLLIVGVIFISAYIAREPIPESGSSKASTL